MKRLLDARDGLTRHVCDESLRDRYGRDALHAHETSRERGRVYPPLLLAFCYR